MKTKDYMSKNQEIIKKWQKEYETRGGDSTKFCWDGIMFRGKLRKADNSNYWIHDESEDHRENQLWSEVKPRILFLTKDQNLGNEEAWDVRQESYLHPNSKPEEYWLRKDCPLFKMIVYSLYGLANTTPEKTICWNDIKDADALQFEENYPFARINCKKEGGTNCCPNPLLHKAIEEYSNYLEEQINNLHADIFVCFGSSEGGYEVDKQNLSLDFLNHHGYNFKYIGKDNIYYDEVKNKVAIDSYHPNYRGIKDKEKYNEIVQTYYQFLQAHPDFLKLIKR